MESDGIDQPDAEPELRIEVEPDLRGRVVLNLHGVLDLHEVGELRLVLTEALALEGLEATPERSHEFGHEPGPEIGTAAGPDVVIDLTDLTFIGSSGMGLLVQAHQDLDKQGRRLIVRGASHRIQRAFEITHLNRVFIFE